MVDEVSEQSAVFTPPQTGAVVNTTYVPRQMKAFAVYEAELDSLTTQTHTATTFFSVAAALLGYAIGIVTNAMFAEKLTPAGELATKVGVPLLVVLACVFGCLAWQYRTNRQAQLDQIRKREAADL
jgi:hypothetical protein